jgi:hypothetical protein
LITAPLFTLIKAATRDAAVVAGGHREAAYDVNRVGVQVFPDLSEHVQQSHE